MNWNARVGRGWDFSLGTVKLVMLLPELGTGEYRGRPAKETLQQEELSWCGRVSQTVF